MRVDLHMHSSASFDCDEAPAAVARRCRRLGLWPVCLTDHDTIDGAVELARSQPDGVVIGQEITTTEGELIGLFLTAPVAAGLSPDRAVEAIRAQGGLVYLQHPYDRTRRCLSEDAIERLQHEIDIVEVFNGRSSEENNRRAEDLRATLAVPGGAGSDAHALAEIGRAYVEMEPFAGRDDFLVKLRAGRIVRHPNTTVMALRAALGR